MSIPATEPIPSPAAPSLRTRWRLAQLLCADSLTQSLVASVSASLACRVVGLGRNIALAWLISKSEYGVFGIASLAANTLMPVCSLGLYEGAARYVPLYESRGMVQPFLRRLGGLLAAVLTITCGWFALSASVVGPLMFSAAGADAVTTASAAPRTLLWFVLGCVAALAFHHTMLGAFKGLRMFRAIGLTELFTAVIFTICVVAAAGIGFRTATPLLLLHALTALLPVLLLMPALRHVGRGETAAPAPSADRVEAPLFRYSVWAAGTALLWHALGYYPMWYLLKVSNGDTVGTFQGVRTITQVVQMGAVIVTNIVASNVTAVWERNGRDAAIPRLVLLTKAGLVALLLGATAMSAAKPLIMRIFPATYAAGAVAYDPLVLFFLLVGMIGVFAIRLNLVERPSRVFVAWAVGAALNVGTTYLLCGAPHSEPPRPELALLKGAAIAGVVGVVVAVALCLFFSHRAGVGIDWGTFFLLIAAMPVALGMWPAVASAAVVLVLLATTNVILDRDGRRMLFETLRTSIVR